MRILVTGVTGFAGGHLAEALLARGDTVTGVGRAGAWPAPLTHLSGRVDLRACDLCDVAALTALLEDVRPDRICHLAGYARTGRSFEEPDAAWDGNLTTTRRLYDAVARWGGRPRILFIGSGLIYGNGAASDRPADESAPLRPGSPYAASKAAADLVSYQVYCAPGLEVVRARPFNHVGPRQDAEFAVAHFARQVVAVERGRQAPVLETGDLRPSRDLTDVRDTVAAYVLLLEHGRAGEAYNVASGQAYTMQTVLDRLLALAGLTAEVHQRTELVRPTEQASVHADASKLRRETGWRPRFTLDQTLADTLDYWRRLPPSPTKGE
jgi:GDP-4-dehydro-6-deoxy-D-mannose reductase